MPLENKYKDYLLEDFVSDDDFITWVQGGHTEVEEWVNAHPEKAKLIISIHFSGNFVITNG